jgi:hypothetical protein
MENEVSGRDEKADSCKTVSLNGIRNTDVVGRITGL